MKKIISVVGARPNFMKIAPIDKALQKYSDKIKHQIVHTGQHYDYQMSDAFFYDLNMPSPSHFLGVGSGSHSEQTAKVMLEFEKICLSEKPDLVIVPGDVNSTLAASIAASKLGIKLAHIESGLRSFDKNMPEEINRIVTDSIADFLFVTEKSGVENLKNEGKKDEQIFFVGNTMIDSLSQAKPLADKSVLIEKLDLRKKGYALVTLHRPSNVDEKEQLSDIIDIFDFVSKHNKVVFPIHPRTRKNLEKFDLSHRIKNKQELLFLEPLGYIDFLALMSNAKFVLTDSGGIQEETTVLGVDCLTIRTTTERPITCEIGTNHLIEPKKEKIIQAIEELYANPQKEHSVPPLWDGKAGERIAEIIINLVS